LMKRGFLNIQFSGKIRLKLISFERRLLYVACTRAQCLLYLLYSDQRQVAGKTREKSLSEFIAVPKAKNAVSKHPPEMEIEFTNVVSNFSIQTYPVFYQLTVPWSVVFSIETCQMRRKLK
jgi:ATP-dependent exoDNAse (exonuclease V) beta subunit